MVLIASVASLPTSLSSMGSWHANGSSRYGGTISRYAGTISRYADGISLYSVLASASPLLLLVLAVLFPKLVFGPNCRSSQHFSRFHSWLGRGTPPHSLPLCTYGSSILMPSAFASVPLAAPRLQHSTISFSQFKF